jgi:hypothetical protein
VLAAHPRRRADAAARYLIEQGVDRSRIGTGGLGEEEPIATNDTEPGRQQNRRIEVAPTEVCTELVDGQGPPWCCAHETRTPVG